MERKLFNFALQNQGVDSRVNRARASMLPNGLQPDELSADRLKAWENVLGADFLQRVLLMADPQSDASLIPEQLVVSGGWCALRTADANDLDKGIVMDPQTGTPTPIKSVEQVTDFIRNGAAFDQIVDAIGTPNNPALERVSISESKLWADKIVQKMIRNGMQLTDADRDAIVAAVEQAEIARYQMTERYMRIMTGNPNLSLTRVPDYEVLEDITRARDELLREAHVNLGSLARTYPDEKDKVGNGSIIYSMYSQPYFEALQSRGFISPQRKTFLIVEPVFHAWADSQTGDYLVDKVHRDAGVYFQRGINSNTGQVAYVECISPNKQSVRRELKCAQVPNVTNFYALLESGELAAEQNLILDPMQNKLFLWGMNILPTGATLQALEGLISAKQDFDREKKEISDRTKGRADVQQVVASMRARYISERVLPLNAVINEELGMLFLTLTDGIV